MNPSFVPRSLPFFVLRLAFSIIHGSGRARKTGKAWEHLSRDDVRWTWGGPWVGQFPISSTDAINLRASFLLAKRSTRDLVIYNAVP